MKLQSLHKLYVDLLKDIYSAENQILQALPKMAENASHTPLKRAFEEHLQETKHQVNRLHKIFQSLEFEPGGEQCEAMEGLIKEGEHLMSKATDDDVRDAAMIIAAQKVEHYEIASYGAACSLAKALGRDPDAELLHTTLEEERSADQKLSDLAQQSINADALAAG